MPSFSIQKMTALRQPIILERCAILAHMAVDYGSVRLSSVNLTLLPNGDFRIHVPTYGKARVVFTDREERQQLLDSALAAYKALTGCKIAEKPVAKASDDLEPSHDPS